jgi:hypothetical protein
VLLKLAENAVKFTEQGSVELSVQVCQVQRSVVQFEVRDTGIGISRDDQQRLFQYFEQSDNGLARRYGGSGLGLAIARRLVELMGGASSARAGRAGQPLRVLRSACHEQRRVGAPRFRLMNLHLAARRLVQLTFKTGQFTNLTGVGRLFLIKQPFGHVAIFR